MNRPQFPRRDATCLVCEDPVPLPLQIEQQGKDGMVCDDPECRLALQRRDRMDPLAFQHYVVFQRRELARRREARAAERERMRKIEQVVTREHEAIRRKLGVLAPDLPPERTHLVEIPLLSAELHSPPEDRVEAYLEHVRRIVSQAVEIVAREPDSDGDTSAGSRCREVEQRFEELPPLRDVSDDLCGLCKGGCCTAGGDTAYLVPETAVRILRERPGWSGEDLVAAYVDHLAPETVSESCVNHTATGCALPRDLRSDTCNGFYCSALEGYHGWVAGSDDTGAVVAIQRSGSYWARYARGKDRTIRSLTLMEGDDRRGIEVDDDIREAGVVEGEG